MDNKKSARSRFIVTISNHALSARASQKRLSQTRLLKQSIANLFELEISYAKAIPDVSIHGSVPAQHLFVGCVEVSRLNVKKRFDMGHANFVCINPLKLGHSLSDLFQFLLVLFVMVYNFSA